MFLFSVPVTCTRRVLSTRKLELEGRLTSDSSRTGKKRETRLHIEVSGEGNDLWRLEPVFELLRDPSRGAVGILPTDTSYAFVCNLHSRAGVERIYALKKTPPSVRKPLSLLCRNHSTIQRYTTVMDKRTFKVLRSLLPGPYTFILPATHEVPRVMIENRTHRKMWKRREVGIRWPREPHCQAVMDALDGVALLASSVPDIDSEEDELAGDPAKILAQWERQVDFIISAGSLSSDMKSTVVDVLRGWQVLREGLGYKEFREVLALEYGSEFAAQGGLETSSRDKSVSA